ncbi:hypothetical protein [Ruegeria arenilitoris]|uniref:hypothetical protein n=1 Tax=Ruegeria arenilitoris TaxID=1173585 RepID=UPI001480EA56|nr:hypothetical protein [Ruegeria arenilitoris]
MKKEELYKQKPFLVGGSLSVLVFGVFAYFLSVGEVCNWAGVCETKWQYLQNASPNEIGDTLAGFAGTLAFIWIVVTVWLQAEELQEQRKEFIKMADAQREQAEIMDVQKDIFLKEQKQREEIEAKEELESLKQRLFRQLEVFGETPLRWNWSGDEGSCELGIECREHDREERIDMFCLRLHQAQGYFLPAETSFQLNFLRKPVVPRSASFIASTLQQIKKVLPNLSQAQQIRAQDLGLDFAADDWSALLKQSDIWDEEQ